MDELRNKVLEAVARGWCSKDNEHKIMDAALALAIVDEVMKALSSEEQDNIGTVAYMSGVADGKAAERERCAEQQEQVDYKSKLIELLNAMDAEIARLREFLFDIANMPEHDQDDVYRLRYKAERALAEEK